MALIHNNEVFIKALSAPDAKHSQTSPNPLTSVPVRVYYSYLLFIIFSATCLSDASNGSTSVTSVGTTTSTATFIKTSSSTSSITTLESEHSFSILVLM